MVLRLVTNPPSSELTIGEKTNYIKFMIHSFASLEDDVVRPNVLALVSLPMWKCLSIKRREHEFQNNPSLMDLWSEIEKKSTKITKNSSNQFESNYMSLLLDNFLEMLKLVPDDKSIKVQRNILLNLERHLEFIVDLLSQLPTRRFFRVLLEDKQFIGLFQAFLFYK